MGGPLWKCGVAEAATPSMPCPATPGSRRQPLFRTMVRFTGRARGRMVGARPTQREEGGRHGSAMAWGGSRHLSGSLSRPPCSTSPGPAPVSGTRVFPMACPAPGASPEPLPAAFPVRDGPGWSGIVRDSPACPPSPEPVDFLDRRLGLPEWVDRIDETDFRCPSRNDGRWRSLQSKDGGGRAGPRGGNSRSTPSSGPKCARTTLARSRRPGPRPTASRRISRASSSMERSLSPARPRAAAAPVAGRRRSLIPWPRPIRSPP